MKSFKFIDLFAGIGGFRTALQQLGGTCVFSSEWDKFSQQTYFANYGELPYGDITKLTQTEDFENLIEQTIEDFDVLCAGFPCQPFSLAGVSARSSLGLKHGFECETQGTLFFDAMRIASVKRPKVLFFENVKNLKSHDGGRTFEVILRSIRELGYVPYWQVINSSTEVAQNRKRCYIVCLRGDLWASYQFPTFSGPELPLSSALDEAPDLSLTISDRLWEGHQDRTQRNLARGAGFSAFTADITRPSNTIVARYGKDGKECLIEQPGRNPRMLSISEMKRLFGYPADFKVPVSKTQAYRQFGNSVVIPVVRKIAQNFVGIL
ncbi:putative C-5 cytosine methyltransferase [Pseudomonas phage Kopi]|uniref:Cytosine-specific methyltransferase n=1 Tax=Pseudomonas phage Kopi TaxID=2880993 RepID=A0AAE8Y8H7_9CAUD|nr:putative C-5 cytosine methyltransferase [Pseudomonas phage Kopi]UDF60320.1 putative C-5 cytosine methyltransferase [Pseudomonas phage Kopi]